MFQVFHQYQSIQRIHSDQQLPVHHYNHLYQSIQKFQSNRKYHLYQSIQKFLIYHYILKCLSTQNSYYNHLYH